MNIDDQIRGLKQQLLMQRGMLAEAEQSVKALRAEAHCTEGRILQLQDMKKQQAEKEKQQTAAEKEG